MSILARRKEWLGWAIGEGGLLEPAFARTTAKEIEKIGHAMPRAQFAQLIVEAADRRVGDTVRSEGGTDTLRFYAASILAWANPPRPGCPFQVIQIFLDLIEAVIKPSDRYLNSCEMIGRRLLGAVHDGEIPCVSANILSDRERFLRQRIEIVREADTSGRIRPNVLADTKSFDDYYDEYGEPFVSHCRKLLRDPSVLKNHDQISSWKFFAASMETQRPPES